MNINDAKIVKFITSVIDIDKSILKNDDLFSEFIYLRTASFSIRGRILMDYTQSILLSIGKAKKI